MIDWAFILSLGALGSFSGLMAGMLGIGGGLLLVPFLTYFLVGAGTPHDHIVQASIGTSLGIIVFTSISSIKAHHKTGAIKWDVVKAITPGLLLGGVIGSSIAASLPTQQLALVFGAFVIFSSYQMFADKKPKPSRVLPGSTGLAGVGTVIGTASSLVGAGGGFLSLPFMVWCNTPLRNAVATSAALGLPIAIFSSTGYIYNGWALADMPWGYLGYIHLPAVASVSAVSMLTAPIGAKLAHSLPVKRIKRIFAIMLACIALSMVYKAITGF